MNKKNLIIVVLILIVAMIAISIVVTNINTQKTTEMDVLTDSRLNVGDNVTLNLTSNGTGMANQKIKITVIDENNETAEYSVVTNNEGIANFTLDGIAEGKYILRCSYEGNDQYKPASLTVALIIQDETPEVVNYTYSNYTYDYSDYDYSDYYSSSQDYGNDYYYSEDTYQSEDNYNQ